MKQQRIVVKFPVALVNYALLSRKKQDGHTYVTNQFIKPITTWLILKAATPQSVINNYMDQLEDLSFLCECSTQTFKKRLRWIVSEGLATIEGNNIKLKSYKQLSTQYFINLDNYKLITYDPTTDKKIHLHMFAIDIDENKNRQKHMVQRKMNNNPVLKQKIQHVLINCGANEKRLANFDYMLNGMRKIYQASFITEPEIHSLLSQVRPDCNRGVQTMAHHWDFAHKQSVSYYKKLMQKAGIVRIHKGEAIASSVRSRNNDCHVIWDKRKKRTVLRLVDTIEVISKTPKPDALPLEK